MFYGVEIAQSYFFVWCCLDGLYVCDKIGFIFVSDFGQRFAHFVRDTALYISLRVRFSKSLLWACEAVKNTKQNFFGSCLYRSLRTSR
jgi:hypothetical protein